MQSVSKFFLKAIILLVATTSLSDAPAFADDDAANPEVVSSLTDESICVPRCVRRSISGTCWQYGRDFCFPSPGTACIPQCVSRSVHERCMNYTIDYCGVYPICEPVCSRRSINGNCMSWGADQCWTAYP